MPMQLDITVTVIDYFLQKYRVTCNICSTWLIKYVTFPTLEILY